MATASSYNVAGVRESLTDLLTILEPEETPVLSRLNKAAAPGAAYHEWQVDDLSTPAFAGIVEGEDVSSFVNKSENRARIGNYVQKFRRTWKVTDILEASDVAGVASEVANAKSKVTRELKRDLEAAICSDQDRQADTGTLPYKFRALGAWIASASPSDVPASFRTPSASIDATAGASLAESTVNGVLQSMFEVSGGKKDYFVPCGPSFKSYVSNFQRATGSSGTTKTYQVTQDAGSHRIDLSVDVFNSDFGMITLVPTMFNGRTSGGSVGATQRMRAYVIDPELVSVAYMKPLGSSDLPDEGGGKRGYVDTILTLVVKNPKGLGKFNATA